MRLITIPTEKVTYKIGNAYKGTELVPLHETVTFLEWLEELAHNTKDFGLGVKGAKRMRRIARSIDDAEEKKAEILRMADDDYADMKKTLDTMQYAPAKADAVLDFMEEFEKAQEEKGPA